MEQSLDIEEEQSTEIEPDGMFYRKCAWAAEKIEVLRRRRRLFVRGLVIGIVLAVGLSFLLPNRYEADLSMMPPDSSSLSMVSMLMGNAGQDASSGGGGAAAGMAGAAVGDLLGLKDASQLYIHAAQGQTVSDRIIRRFDLMKIYHCNYIEDCRRTLAHNVTLEEDKKAGTIDVTVYDKDSKRAAAIANAYPEELNKLLLEVNAQSARQEREATAARVEEARKELEDASNQLAQFSSKNTTLEPDDQGKAAISISAAIEGELIAAQSDLKSMEQIYTSNNQRVYSARARVSELQQQLQKANSAGLKGGGEDGSMPSVRQLPILGVQYLTLFRTEKVREYVYRVLTQEYELARIREKFQVDTVSVLDAAAVPTKEAFPSLKMRIILLVFLAFLLSAAFTVLSDWWQAEDSENHWKLLLSPAVAGLASLFARRKRAEHRV